MTFHVAAYFLNADLAGALTPLNAVLDQALNTEDTFIRVPQALPNLVAEAAVSAAATLNSAFVRSPSMRVLANQAISIMDAIATLSDKGAQMHAMNPRQLAPQEGVELVQNTDDAAVQDHHGFIWLADGALTPISGNIFTTRATATITAAAATWTLGDLDFVERLPIATYQVVGMRVVATGGGVARLVFPGLPWRPGSPVAQDIETAEFNDFRYGRWGVWGAFDLNQPPQLELIGGTSTAQNVFLDLVRSG